MGFRTLAKPSPPFVESPGGREKGRVPPARQPQGHGRPAGLLWPQDKDGHFWLGAGQCLGPPLPLPPRPWLLRTCVLSRSPAGVSPRLRTHPEGVEGLPGLIGQAPAAGPLRPGVLGKEGPETGEWARVAETAAALCPHAVEGGAQESGRSLAPPCSLPLHLWVSVSLTCSEGDR